MDNKNKILTLVICLILVTFVSYAGSMFTSKETSSSWYQSIKPPITPPNYVFPIVWTTLYILLAFSMYFAWINIKKTDIKQKNKIKLLFAINLIFNIIWSLAFFGEKNVLAGLFAIFIIFLSIIVCMFEVKKISKTSFWLLWPYLIWVTFATILNLLIIIK